MARRGSEGPLANNNGAGYGKLEFSVRQHKTEILVHPGQLGVAPTLITFICVFKFRYHFSESRTFPTKKLLLQSYKKKEEKKNHIIRSWPGHQLSPI